jgi:hypothetical protein
LERPLRYLQNQPVVSETISRKHFLAHWLDQYVAVTKLASLQMVDTYAIDFDNVQRTLVFFKSSTQ